jgi:trehalose 6-phosphate phosphatase
VSPPEPSTKAGRAGLAALRADLGGALVVVDFDGTLSDIVEHPSDARLVAGGPQALRRLAARVGRLAVVTGRAATEVVDLAGLADVGGVTVFGHYGLQRWEAGVVSSPAPDPAVDRALAALPGVLAGGDPGVRIEDKTHSVAVHTRSAADPDAELARIDGPLRGLAAGLGLELVEGRLVRELRPAGADKGLVVRTLAAEVRPSAVLVAGDDTGDLPAFGAVRALRSAGTPGVCVAVRGPGAAPEVGAAADLVLDGPAGLVAFLSGLAAQD